MELYLPPVKENKRAARPKIKWTDEMLRELTDRFPHEFTFMLVKSLEISPRSIIRKARELGLEKEPGFLEARKDQITELAVKAHPPHPYKGVSGWSVPNSEKSRFKQGNISVMAIDRDVVEKVRTRRNATIRRERIRLSLDLKPLTKLRLTI